MADEKNGAIQERIETIRLFVGIVLPDAARDRLREISARLRSSAERARVHASWERPEKMHITVKFLGAFPADEVARLSASLDAATAAHAPFEAELDAVGSFPPNRPPRVIFAAVGQGAAPLAALAADIDAACASLGVPREARRFHGHVTLARVKSAPRSLRVVDLLPADLALRERVPVGEIVLFRSELGRGGSTHHVLSRHPLIRDIRNVPAT